MENDFGWRLRLNEDGGKNYLIRDDLFQHLIIMQLEEGYLVHNCSVIK